MPRPASQKTTVGAARAALGISAMQLASRSGVGLSTIQKIERQQHPITVDTGKKLAVGLMVDPSWLVYGSPEDGPQWLEGKPWNPDEANKVYRELKNHTLWSEETKASAEKCAGSISRSFASIANGAVKNGTIFTLFFEYQIFLRTLLDSTKVIPKEIAKELREAISIEKPKRKPVKQPKD